MSSATVDHTIVETGFLDILSGLPTVILDYNSRVCHLWMGVILTGNMIIRKAKSLAKVRTMS